MGITERTIRYIKRKENKYENVINKNKKTTLHSGVEAIKDNFDSITTFIEENRPNDFPVNTYSIYIEFISN